MQSENLLRSDYYENGIGNGGAHLSSQSNSPHHSYSSNGDASVSPPNGVFHVQHLNVGQNYALHNNTPPSSALSHNNSLSIGSLQHASLGAHPSSSPDDHRSSSNSTTNHHHQQNSPSSSSTSGLALIHGGTPLSQIGANICPPVSQHDTFVQSMRHFPLSTSLVFTINILVTYVSSVL